MDTNNTQSFKVYLIGETSSGKSSVINSVVGGLVSNSSLQRETLNLLEFEISPHGTEENIKLVTSKLEEVHKLNEIKRADITKLNVNELNEIIKCEHILPSRYNIGSLNLIDFPGINDAGDIQDLFMKIFENKLSGANCIVYVTDASKAFISSSEVKNFKKIKLSIDNYNKNGNFIDLIILVNKFDDMSDQSLNEIFDKISSKTKIDSSKIMKYSSHQTLINSLVDNKINLLIPKTKTNYLQREVVNILKHANVKQTSSLINSIKNESVLNHNDITFTRNESWDNFLSDTEEDIFESSEKLNPFFDYLKSFRTENISKQIKSFNKHYHDLLENIFQLDSYSKIMNSCSKINFGDLYHNKIKSDIICDIAINKLDDFEPDNTNSGLLGILFDYAILITHQRLGKKIIQIMTEKYTSISNRTNQYVFYKNIMSGLVSLDDYNCVPWIRYVFSSDETMYTLNYSLEIFDIITNKWQTMIGNNGIRPVNWYIEDIINSEHASDSLKFILSLSNYSVNDLYFLNRTKSLDFFCKSFKDDVIMDIYDTMIINVEWIKLKPSYKTSPVALFKEYADSIHEKFMNSVLLDFTTNKNDLLIHHKIVSVNNTYDEESDEEESSSDSEKEKKKPILSDKPFNYKFSKGGKVPHIKPSEEYSKNNPKSFVKKKKEESDSESDEYPKKRASPRKELDSDSDSEESIEKKPIKGAPKINTYIQFVQRRMPELKKANPSLNQKELMLMCAKEWNNGKANNPNKKGGKPCGPRPKQRKYSTSSSDSDTYSTSDSDDY